MSMPRFAANLSMMYAGARVPRSLRGRRSATASRRSNTCFRTSIRRPSSCRALQASGLGQVLFNAPPGDWAAGERGMACLPGRRMNFAPGVQPQRSTTPECSTVRAST